MRIGLGANGPSTTATSDQRRQLNTRARVTGGGHSLQQYPQLARLRRALIMPIYLPIPAVFFSVILNFRMDVRQTHPLSTINTKISNFLQNYRLNNNIKKSFSVANKYR